ncbi:MAG: T9SS type A sorting domain-containing protein [Candidatus Eisenbacteria bacterium]|nr:T9SS type A sorting domain-containing protein [Candidatus Eisenbacteria bacterium]
MHLRTASFPRQSASHLARLHVALAVLLLASTLGASPASATQSKAFVVTSDYSTGGLSAVDLTTRAVSVDVSTVYSDATLRWYDGKIYVVNRFGQDNIQVIDPASAYATVLQFSTGVGTNPQDIAFLTPTRAFVPLYERTALLVCNPQTGATLDTISLAAFADADHLPEMAHVALVGNRLFVAIQRLDRAHGYVPTAYSLVAVIDAQADTVLDADPITPGKQAIRLTGTNPVTTFSYVPSTRRLLIGCAGSYGAADGGIDAIDVDSMQDLGFIATEATLGGDLGDIEWFSPTHGYAIVSDAFFNANLVSFNPSNGALIGTVRSPGGFSLPDCAVNDRGELYVADNSFTTAGIYVYRAGVDTLITGPLNTGLPPNQIAFDAARDEVADVTPLATGTEFAAPWPNPARNQASFDLRLSAPSLVRIEAFDLSGRRVATLANGARVAGTFHLAWDLADERGRALAPGVYLVRALIGDRAITRRLVVVR